MGKYEGQIGECSSDKLVHSSSFKLSSISTDCSSLSAAIIATSAAYSAIIVPFFTTTKSTTVAKLGANATRHDNYISTRKIRNSNKNLGKCFTKRGWWSR